MQVSSGQVGLILGIILSTHRLSRAGSRDHFPRVGLELGASL